MKWIDLIYPNRPSHQQTTLHQSTSATLTKSSLASSLILSPRYIIDMFNWLLEEKVEETSPRFVPRIVVAPKSTLHLEVEPRDPTTTSNLIITAFANPHSRKIIDIRVEWSRFRIRTDSPHTQERIHCLTGNSYSCEPTDAGGYIRAVVRPRDSQTAGEAEVTIGPIAIDVMLKQNIERALYSGSLLSHVVVTEREERKHIEVRLNTRTIDFSDGLSRLKLTKDYTMSEPKLELNPKDPERVYLRFEQDQNNTVREWLDAVFGLRNSRADESSLSIKVPYAGHSSSSSKVRLFQKSHTPCLNKLQLKFQSRLARDLFLFTHRAFICRQDLKNSLYIQRIETLTAINTEKDYYKFLEFIGLKNEISRLADYAKEVEDDRNAKVKDLIAMEESISEMTMTYIKIIENKAKNDQIDFEHSYSQINNTREEMNQRKNMREMKAENEALKQKLRELTEQIEFQNFLKKEENQSMIFNQTTNPFAKKDVHAASPQLNRSHRNQMYEMSINYANLLDQNRQLKAQLHGKPMDKSQNMVQLLGSLEEHEDREQRISDMQRTIAQQRKEIEDLKRKLEEGTAKKGIAMIKINKSIDQSMLLGSSLNQSAQSFMNESNLNMSMTSEAAVAKLEQNLRTLGLLNARLQEDNSRLRKQRDYYKNEVSKHGQPLDQSRLMRAIEDKETLENEKKALQRKLESLSKQPSPALKEELLQNQRKIRQLQVQNTALKQQTIKLKLQKETSKEESNLGEGKRLKQINAQLLQRIKQLKMELEQRLGDNMYNSRVIQLQNQLENAKNGQTEPSNQTQRLMQQINELTKTNAKLKQQNQDLQTKLQHQASTIERLADTNHSPPSKGNSLPSTTSKEKAFSERISQHSNEEIDKYKRQIKKLQEEVLIMRRSADAINCSRDLTLDMDGYYEEKIDLMRREMQSVYADNENLSKMCERYGRDAREAAKQLKKWREKAMQLMMVRSDEASLLSE